MSSESSAISPEQDAQAHELCQHFSTLLRSISAEQVASFTGSEPPAICDIDYYTPGQVLANEMILLSVSGPALQLLFKIHFNYQQAQSRLKQNVHEGSGPLSVKDIDFMKELGNQLCGAFCRKLASQDIDAGLSIPLSTRGYYEAHADYTNKISPLLKFGEGWALEGDFGTLYFSSYTEIMDNQMIAPLLAISLEDDADDDIDFF